MTATAPRTFGAHIVRRELEESASVKRSFDDALCEAVALTADVIVESVRAGGKVLLFGNGGSAADAQHLAAELVGRYRREREPIRAMSLTGNSSTVTSIGNDYAFEEVFARQVRGWAEKGDVVIGLTTSGNSPNVVKALAVAREKGAVTVALTGAGGGACAALCDHLLAVPSSSTPRIQEAHITLGHILCGLVEHRWCELEGR